MGASTLQGALFPDTYVQRYIKHPVCDDIEHQFRVSKEKTHIDIVNSKSFQNINQIVFYFPILTIWFHALYYRRSTHFYGLGIYMDIGAENLLFQG